MKRAKKMPDVTPKGIIIHKLRLLWLHSRERRAALKRDGYTCQDCQRKQSTAKGKEFKVQVDHLTENIDWNVLVEYIRRHLLVSPDKLETVCKPCHLKRTELRKQIQGGDNGAILQRLDLAVLDPHRAENISVDRGRSNGDCLDHQSPRELREENERLKAEIDSLKRSNAWLSDEALSFETRWRAVQERNNGH